jgi:hypothetical protein
MTNENAAPGIWTKNYKKMTKANSKCRVRAPRDVRRFLHKISLSSVPAARVPNVIFPVAAAKAAVSLRDLAVWAGRCERGLARRNRHIPAGGGGRMSSRGSTVNLVSLH